MNQMTLKELYEVGCSFESSVGEGTKSERARIPKNSSRITFDEDLTNNIINFEKEVTIPKEKFCNKLGITCKSIIISNIKRNSTNRVESIIINGKKFTGIEVRKTLGLRSTDFVIKLNENDINITTYGYGHGVGMSQYGANYLANQGFNYEYILKYYYKDVIISSIN